MAVSEEDAKADEARFLALVSGLSSSVMQHLGKVINPLTGKIERNLEAAKGTIDLLRMLREKTRGNLCDREQRTLNALLSSVQLNYVDELKAEAEKPKEKPEEKAAEEKKEEPPPEEEKPVEAKEAGAGEQKGELASEEERPPPEQKTGKRKKARKKKRSSL